MGFTEDWQEKRYFLQKKKMNASLEFTKMHVGDSPNTQKRVPWSDENTLEFVFSPLSCPALWQKNCNVNTVYTTHIRFAKRSFMNVKLPFDAQELLIYLFLSQYLVPNWTGGQEKRKSKEKETEQK